MRQLNETKLPPLRPTISDHPKPPPHSQWGQQYIEHPPPRKPTEKPLHAANNPWFFFFFIIDAVWWGPLDTPQPNGPTAQTPHKRVIWQQEWWIIPPTTSVKRLGGHRNCRRQTAAAANEEKNSPCWCGSARPHLWVIDSRRGLI